MSRQARPRPAAAQSAFPPSSAGCAGNLGWSRLRAGWVWSAYFSMRGCVKIALTGGRIHATYIESWSHWKAKLRDWAVRPVMAGCYSWSALYLIDSKTVQGWAKEMDLSWEKVSTQLQPATAGHARLVLSKTVPFFCTTLYIHMDKNFTFPETLFLSKSFQYYENKIEMWYIHSKKVIHHRIQYISNSSECLALYRGKFLSMYAL